MFVGLALAVSTSPVAPGSEQLEKDISAVQTAHVDVVALNFAKCVAEKIRVYKPRDEEKGDRGKAALYLKGALAACNQADATNQVRDGLKASRPDASLVDINRQVGTAFAFPTLGLIMLLNKAFGIGPTTSRPESPAEIAPPSN